MDRSLEPHPARKDLRRYRTARAGGRAVSTSTANQRQHVRCLRGSAQVSTKGIRATKGEKQPVADSKRSVSIHKPSHSSACATDSKSQWSEEAARTCAM